MVKWKQTGKGERTTDVPLSLDVLEHDLYGVTCVVPGEFDGYVYIASPVGEYDGHIIEWYRYPAELVPGDAPVAPDYANSAE